MCAMKHLWQASVLMACLFGSVGLSQSAGAQTSAWTWIGGSNTSNQPGIYGQVGNPSTKNVPPGRWDAARWTDNSGNFWLFGGSGYDATTNATGVLLNDLWEFSPSSSEWIWIAGSSSTEIQSSGVYGTLGTPGVGNIPGSRTGAVSWTDGKGNLWLFGGTGLDSSGNTGALNDLWDYNPSTNQWTWMGGSITIGTNGGQPGVYGTLGTPSAGNIPGGRTGAVSWTDGSGNLWLSGGDGYDANGSSGVLNDLWQFNSSSNEWTWMGGSSTVGVNGGQPGVYGTLGMPAPRNIPGGRSGTVSWIDGTGNFWLFGGSGYDANGNLTALNDLWDLKSSPDEWEWMGGSTSSAGCVTYKLGLIICRGQPGIYGTLGTPAAGNIPGGRSAAVSWTDKGGNFWLFGGSGYDSTGNEGNLNDLWQFDPSSSEWTWIGGSNTEAGCGISPEGNTLCKGQSGVYGTLGVPDSTNDPGARFGASNWIDKKGNFWLFGGYGSASVGSSGVLNDLWEYQQAATAILPDFSTTVSPESMTLTTGQSGTVTITVTPMDGFNSVVSFDCSGLPSGASCSFSPANVTPLLTPASTTLTVSKSAATAVVGHNASPLFAVVAVAPFLWCLGRKKRRPLPHMVLLTICGVGLSLLSGCGSSLSSHSTTSIVTVTATSGSLQHTTSFTLTVD